MFSLLSWIVVGLIVGVIARALVPGKQSLGLIMTIILGVVGAFVGGLISSAFWPEWEQQSGCQSHVARVAHVDLGRRNRSLGLRRPHESADFGGVK